MDAIGLGMSSYTFVCVCVWDSVLTHFVLRLLLALTHMICEG